MHTSPQHIDNNTYVSTMVVLDNTHNPQLEEEEEEESSVVESVTEEEIMTERSELGR